MPRLAILLTLLCCSSGLAQHSDVFVYQQDSTLITTGNGIERRVFSRLFDFFGHPFGNMSLPKAFVADDPGFQTDDSPISGASVLPVDAVLSGDFLPFRIPNGSEGNVLRWDLAAPTNFQAIPNGHSFTITDVSGDSSFELHGDNQSVESVLLGLVGSNHDIHEHVSWALDDGDGNSATDPANGIYLMMMQLNMDGVGTSEPFAVMLNSPDVSVADQATATSWVTDQLDSFVILGNSPTADFDNNGALDLADIDLLVAAVAGQSNDLIFDLDGNGTIGLSDVATWRAIAGQANLTSGSAYLAGDSNLDGVVDVSDFSIWLGNNTSNTAAWSVGDFNADGFVDFSDFNIWNSNKFQSSNAAMAVPEPHGPVSIVVASFLFAGMLRTRSESITKET